MRKKMTKKLNEMDSETVHKNFLSEEPEIPTEKKIVTSVHIPRMVKIRFLNNRDPGVCLHFHYSSKTHPLKHYDLMHGFEYELSEEVVGHLEGTLRNDPFSCHQRTYSRRMRDDGISETYASGYVPYFQCQTLRAA
jgi:hypothetical protein